MAKKKISKKASKKEEASGEMSYIDWKLPAAFILGILVTVLYYNLPNAGNLFAGNTNSETIPTLYLINDKDCILCNDSWITSSLSNEFNYTLERIDSSSSAGKELIRSMGITSLPAVLLSKDFINSSGYEYLGSYLEESGNYYILSMKGIKNLSATESINPTIDLFVMSKCPYGTPAQQNMINLKKSVPGIELNMHYIVDVLAKSDMDVYVLQYKAQYDAVCADSGVASQYGLLCTEEEWNTKFSPLSSCELKTNGKYYCSLHGPEELNLDIIQICAMNMSENWGDFILSHISSGFNTSFAASASGMDYDALMDCANSSKGLELLDKNIELSNQLSIGASPTYLFDNIYRSDLDPTYIIASNPAKAFCSLHPELSGCESVGSLNLASSSGGSC